MVPLHTHTPWLWKEGKKGRKQSLQISHHLAFHSIFHEQGCLGTTAPSALLGTVTLTQHYYLVCCMNQKFPFVPVATCGVFVPHRRKIRAQDSLNTPPPTHGCRPSPCHLFPSSRAPRHSDPASCTECSPPPPVYEVTSWVQIASLAKITGRYRLLSQFAP